MKQDKRPINVGIGDLLQFRWPIIALASISHRIAGVVLFVGLGLLLYGLEVSLSSPAEFEGLKASLGTRAAYITLVVSAILIALVTVWII